MKNNKIKLIVILMACVMCLSIAFVSCREDESQGPDTTPATSADNSTGSDTNADTGSDDTEADDTGSDDTTGGADTSKIVVGDDNGGDYNKPNPIY
ncbi:MAG: hypothetical protein ACI3XQ_06650 [Eubacteriales bacterium]